MIRPAPAALAICGMLSLGVEVSVGPALAAAPGSRSPAFLLQMLPPPATAPAAPGSAPALPAATPALTLDQAIRAALAQNPQIIAGEEAVRAARQSLVAARAGLAPTLSANGTGRVGGGSATSSTSSGLATAGTVSLGATVPLYDAGRTPAAVSSAAAALAQAEAALRQTQQDTSLAVATAFFSVLTAERLTAVREALLAQAQAQLALSQARVRAGVAAQADVIQAQAQVALAEVDLLTARSQIATAKSSLQAAIGGDAAAPVEVQEPPAPPPDVPVTADAAMKAAEAHRPEVAKAMATLQSDQAALELARINAGPQVTVSVGTTYTPASTDPLLSNSTSYGVTATVGLPFYSPGAQAGVDAAQATVRSARAQLDAALLSMRQDAYQAYLAAVQAAATIPATQAAREAAEAALAVAEGRYKAGVGTIVEVITARATAAQAEVNAVNSLYTYQSALATLRHAQGSPIVASAGGGSQ